MKKRLMSLVMVLSLSAALLAGCGSTRAVSGQAQTTASIEAASESIEAASETTESTAQECAVPTMDRSGNPITIPAQVNSIISMAPATTQLLIDLGLADKIIACDSNSASDYAASLKKDIPQFDMMAPDQEQIVTLKPDLVFTSGMSASGGTDVFASVREAGICIADIPSSSSIAEIEEDIRFTGNCVGAGAAAADIAAQMQKSVDELKKIGAGIADSDRKKVLYEMSTPSSDAPVIYSCGKDTYIDEMITTIGAVNAAEGQDGQWPAITEEAAVGMNPDVILTTDNYTPDVINTLLGLSGWENVTAVKQKAVYLIDANTMSQPNQHIVSAMIAMAKDIYPEQYAEAADPYAVAGTSTTAASGN